MNTVVSPWTILFTIDKVSNRQLECFQKNMIDLLKVLCQIYQNNPVAKVMTSILF